MNNFIYKLIGSFLILISSLFIIPILLTIYKASNIDMPSTSFDFFLEFTPIFFFIFLFICGVLLFRKKVNKGTIIKSNNDDLGTAIKFKWFFWLIVVLLEIYTLSGLYDVILHPGGGDFVGFQLSLGIIGNLMLFTVAGVIFLLRRNNK